MPHKKKTRKILVQSDEQPTHVDTAAERNLLGISESGSQDWIIPYILRSQPPQETNTIEQQLLQPDIDLDILSIIGIRQDPGTQNNILMLFMSNNTTPASVVNKPNAIKHEPPSIEDFEDASAYLGVEIAAIRAIVQTETGDNAYLEDGRPKILFEPEKFQEKTNHKYDKSHPYVSNTSKGHGLNKEQYTKLAEAIALDKEAAYASTSFTFAQIMGENYDKAGDFSSASEFGKAMLKATPEDQLRAFVNYEKHHPKDVEYLKKHDWAHFAKLYNGPDYKDYDYDKNMANNYAKLTQDPLAGLIHRARRGQYPSPIEESLLGAPEPSVPYLLRLKLQPTETTNTTNDVFSIFGNGLPGATGFQPTAWDKGQYYFNAPAGKWENKKPLKIHQKGHWHLRRNTLPPPRTMLASATPSTITYAINIQRPHKSK